MTATWREARLDVLLRDHKAAVREFVERASTIEDSGWLIPRAEGKWTPAQETKHLILAYEAFSRDLRGEAAIALRGTPLKRLLWRAIGLSSILWRKRIPVAVRAPREVRPEWEAMPRQDLIPRLEARAQEFDTLFARAWRDEPKRRVTHPLLGTLSLEHSIRFHSVHTRHHAAFLPAINLVNSLHGHLPDTPHPDGDAMRRLISLTALAVCAACADKSQSSDTTAAADTSAIGQTTSVVAGGAVQQGLLDPNTATREQLLALTMDSASTIILMSRRPYADMLAVDRVLSPRLTEAQRKALYAKLFKPIDLNTATASEILLIPGVGPRMRHEFEEYRPYTSMEQFRREIGKYVDKDEVARLEQYVRIGR